MDWFISKSSPLYISTNNVAEAKTGWEWIDGTQLIYDAASDTWNGFTSWGNGEPNDFQFGNPSARGRTMGSVLEPAKSRRIFLGMTIEILKNFIWKFPLVIL